MKLDYIPADLNLANAEIQMLNALSRETILKRILANISEDYDYILIDCLPSLGLLLINALTAAQQMLIPVQTQKFALDGLTALMQLYGQIQATINPNLKLLGILPTMTDCTTVSRNALEHLQKNYTERIMRTNIHKSVEAAKSSESGKALCQRRHRLGDVYMTLTQEVMRYDNSL
ncbi:MAG: AAA family ATPase [Ruminococcus sp.]|nr:AAA family ATPase [Ruminococcus sp.]